MSAPPAPATRRRGDRAGLTPQVIIEAARELSPSDMTMSAVAARLGVDRKSLHHHVTDRDQLLGLVADDAFLSAFALTAVDVDHGWQAACRSYAWAVRNCVVQSGALAPFVHLRGNLATLRPAEDLLSALWAGGMNRWDAAYMLSTLSSLAITNGRDAILSQQSSNHHPQSTEAQEMLSTLPDDDMPLLRQLRSLDVGDFWVEQFTFALTTLIRGVESRPMG